MKHLYIVFFIFLITSAESQTYQWAISDTTYQWSNGISITLDNADNIAVVETRGDTKNIDVVKYDANHNVIWRKRIYSFLLGTSHIATDNIGNVYYTAGFSTYVNVDGTQYNAPYSGCGRMVLVKFNSMGVVQWVKQTTGVDAGSSGISIDSQNNIYVIGGAGPDGTVYFDSISSNPGLFVAKYNTNGVAQWVRSTSNGDGSSGGYGMAIKVSKSGNIFIGGSLYIPTNFGTHAVANYGDSDAYLAKMDSSGNWLWAIHAGGIYQDAFYGMDIDNYDNVYMTGFYGSPIATFDTVSFTNTSNEDYFLAKYDAGGNVQWAIHGVKDGYYANSFCVDSAGNSYMRPYDKYILKHDRYGVSTWSDQKNASNVRMVSDKKGGVYITGWLSSPTSFGSTTITPVKSQQMYIAKLNEASINTTGTKELFKHSVLEIYPNPCTQQLIISMNEPLTGSIKITNALGVVVYTEFLKEPSTNWSKEIDISRLAKGLYVIEVINTSDKEFVRAKKLIIE